MKLDQIVAVLHIHEHSKGVCTPECIRKLFLLSARVRRLTTRPHSQMTERQRRAMSRALIDAEKLANSIGAYVRVEPRAGLNVVWPDTSITIF